MSSIKVRAKWKSFLGEQARLLSNSVFEKLGTYGWQKEEGGSVLYHSMTSAIANGSIVLCDEEPQNPDPDSVPNIL